jgi:hypothetical protein
MRPSFSGFDAQLSAPYIINIGQVIDCQMASKSSRGMSNIAQMLR